MRYELQKNMLQAEKDRDAGLATTTAVFQQFKQTLAADQETLSKLEGDAQRVFSGYRKFQRRFLSAYETAVPSFQSLPRTFAHTVAK